MLLFNTINDVQLHFATPVLHKCWPDADVRNRELKAVIEEKRRASPGVTISNRGGWQLNDDLLHWQEPCIGAFARWIHSCVMHLYHTYYPGEFARYLEGIGGELAIRVTAWANINARGHWNILHNHPGRAWSGVYYVQAPADSGKIELHDPRPNINMLGLKPPLELFDAVPRQIDPQPGLTLIFPSWLQHSVGTHESDDERISIAFNVNPVLPAQSGGRA